MYHSKRYSHVVYWNNSYRFLFGGTTSGKTVMEHSAMQMTQSIPA